MHRVSCALALAALAACSPRKDERSLTGVEVTPAAPALFAGSTSAFTATAVYSDTTTEDVTEQATWTSDTPSVLSVSDAAGTKGAAQALDGGTARVTASYQGVSGYTDATVTHEGGLVSIQVLPATPAVVVGASLPLFAMGTYEDGSVLPLNAQATWTSDAATIATVSNDAGDEGVATGVAVGTATITATVGYVHGSVTLNVRAFTIDALRIAPDLVMVSSGGSASVRALARDASGGEVDVTSLATWSSDATGIATVTGGAVSGVSEGVAHLSAVHSGKTAAASVVVESASLLALQLSSPASVDVGVGFTAGIRAIGLYSDCSQRDVTGLATWTSDLPVVVDVSDDADSKGVVYASAAGTASVTAAYGGLSATTTFTVAPRAVLWVTIDGVPWPLPVGATQQLAATAMYDDFTAEDVTATAVWSSSSAAVAVGSTGLATASQAGTAIVTASWGGCSDHSLLTAVGQNPTELLVALDSPMLWQGDYTFATVELWYPDGRLWNVSEVAALSSGDVAVASIGEWWNDSVIRAKGPGTTSIQASYAGLTGLATLTVNGATGLTIEAPAQIPQSAAVGATAWAAHTVPSTGSRAVTSSAQWSSSNPSVLTVTSSATSKGVLTGIASGTATITATFAGFTASRTISVRGRVLSIAIEPAFAEVVEHQVATFTATATLGDGTLDVTTWASWSCDGDAAYAFEGLVLGNHPGTSVVSAEMGGARGNALVTVVPEPPLSVDIRPPYPDPIRLPPGSTVKLSVHVENQDFTVRHPQSGVTWTSTNTAVASFSTDPLHAGELTVGASGTTSVFATYGGVDSSERQVIGDTLVSVVETGSATVPAGGSATLPLMGTFSGGTSDLSPLLTWTTTNADVAIVDGGQLLGMRPGTATVQTAIGGHAVSRDVTVGVPTVTALGVSAPSPIAVGAQGPVEVVAMLSNGDHLSVADVAVLSTSTPAILSVTGAAIEALAAGSGSVQADFLGSTGTDAVTVQSGVPWLQIDPMEARAAVGTQTCPYVTTAGAAAASNVTGLAAYATSNAPVAQLSGDCATAMALGTALVTATYGGRTASMLVAVDPVAASPEVVRLWGNDDPVHVFERAEYEATAEPETEPVTRAATWASSTPAVAAMVAPGVFEGVAPGWTAATASIGGFTTSFWVRVLPATLAEIEMQRWAIAVPAGASYPLTVAATYSDGVSGVDVTGAATFSSENTAVATLGALVPSELHAVAAGVTHVVAQVGTKTVRIPVTVF